jgi:hypothetical protein
MASQQYVTSYRLAMAVVNMKNMATGWSLVSINDIGLWPCLALALALALALDYTIPAFQFIIKFGLHESSRYQKKSVIIECF